MHRQGLMNLKGKDNMSDEIKQQPCEETRATASESDIFAPVSMKMLTFAEIEDNTEDSNS